MRLAAGGHGPQETHPISTCVTEFVTAPGTGSNNIFDLLKL